MRYFLIAALTVALAGCFGSSEPAPVAKPCKHATVEACSADPACAWDKNHDPAKSRCKTKEKADTAPPAAAPVVN